MKNLILTASLFAILTTNIFSKEIKNIVIYSAIKTDQNIQDSTASVEVITDIELKEKHFTNLSEALNSVVGLDMTSNGGLGQASFVRIDGMHYTTTLVLIDGVIYNDITNGSAFLEHIQISDIKQIEIIKGAQSGIWGVNSSGGVINIITKNPKVGFFYGGAVELGSFGFMKTDARLSYKNESFYLKTNYNNTKTDGITAKAPKHKDILKYEDDKYSSKTISAKTGFQINETNKIDLSYKSIQSKTQYDGTNTKEDKSEITLKNQFSKINYNHIDSFNRVDIYAKQSTFNRKDPQGWTKEFDGQIQEYGFKSKIPYKDENFLIWGVDKKNYKQTKEYKIKYQDDGLFLTNQNIFDLSGKLIFTQAIRHDRYSKFEDKTTGKIGVSYIKENWTTAANYGTGYKAPSLYEISNSSKDELSPESVKSLDISVKYKDTKIRYFQNKIDDLISYNDNGTAFDFSDDYFENTQGVSTIKGYELSYKKSFFEDILLTFGYTAIDAKDKDNKSLGRVAKELLKVSVDYYGIKKTHIGLYSKYVGERYDQLDKQGEQTGRYTTANMVLNYEIDKRTKIYGKIDNITDKYYQTIDGYATYPRAYYVGLDYQF